MEDENTPQLLKIEEEHKELLEQRNSSTCNNLIDIDDILENIGGSGRYQISWFIIITAGMLSGCFINFSIYYFTLDPIYLYQDKITNKWETCYQEDICNMKIKDMNHRLRDDITFKIDFDDNRSLHNWIEQYHLTCASGNEIGRIGSSFFVGTFIGSILIPRAADVVGRKPMFVLGLVIYIFVIVGLIFATKY